MHHPLGHGVDKLPIQTVILVVGLVAVCLVSPAAADSLDVSVKLYRDPNCFERAEELLLLDNGCYANVYSNQSKAYMLKVVGFTTPGKSDLFEYLDDCHTEFRPKRSLSHARCERFVGAFWAIISTRLRSNTCIGTSCSTLVVAVQSFFRQPGCSGIAYSIQRYAMQNACLRYFNGTQTFRVDTTGRNITQINYNANDLCGGGFAQTYTVFSERCYGFFQDDEPRSFIWRVDRGSTLASSTCRLWSGPTAFISASLAFWAMRALETSAL